MKKIMIVLALTIPVLAKAQIQPSKKEYKSQMDISLIGGIQNNKYFETSAAVYGVQFSLECPLIQTRKSHIRQQFSFIRQEGKKLKTISVELNPLYKLIAKQSFELGAGPSAGLVFAKTSEENKTIFSYGLGASFVYQLKKFFIGFESRYALTKKVSFTNLDNKPESPVVGNLNNLRTFLKFGYKFY